MNGIVSQIMLYLNGLGRAVNKWLGELGGQFDLITMLFGVFVIFLVGFSLGRTKIMLAMMSVYVAVFIEQKFIFIPWLQNRFPNTPEAWLHMGLFLVIYLLTFIVLNRSALKSRLSLKEVSFFSVFFLAVIMTGFFISVLVAYSLEDLVGTGVDLPTIVHNYFGTKIAQLVWAILPVLAAILIKRDTGVKNRGMSSPS